MLTVMIDGDVLRVEKLTVIQELDHPAYGPSPMVYVDLDAEGVRVVATNEVKEDDIVISQGWDDLVDGVDWEPERS